MCERIVTDVRHWAAAACWNVGQGQLMAGLGFTSHGTLDPRL